MNEEVNKTKIFSILDRGMKNPKDISKRDFIELKELFIEYLTPETPKK